MNRRNPILLLLPAVLFITGIAVYFHYHGRPGTAPPGAPATVETARTTTPSASRAAADAAGESFTNKVVHVLPDQILARVNGITLTLKDIIPLKNNEEQEIVQVVYDYFLQRAIDRELIVQTARSRGVTLTDSQEQQLERLRDLRSQSEPGLVSKLTVDAAEIDFEIRDAQAFMLQTTLMEQSGVIPNVTTEQVARYYKDHLSEFAALPDEPLAKQDAWQKIDFEIRGLLANETRQQFNTKLQAFMKGLKNGAEITVSSPM